MAWSRRTISGILLVIAWIALLLAGVPALLVCSARGGISPGVTALNAGPPGNCGEAIWVYLLLVAAGALSVLWLNDALQVAFAGRRR